MTEWGRVGVPHGYSHDPLVLGDWGPRQSRKGVDDLGQRAWLLTEPLSHSHARAHTAWASRKMRLDLEVRPQASWDFRCPSHLSKVLHIEEVEGLEELTPLEAKFLPAGGQEGSNVLKAQELWGEK